MKKSQHVSWELSQRQSPRLYQFSYFSLKRIKREVIKFADFIKIKHNYKILDMWCWNKPYSKYFSWYDTYIGSDLIKGPNVDVVCDNDSLPFDENYFDYLLCNQVLEHTRNIHWAIQEMQRVVKKNWYIFVSLPFLYPEHACPRDYYRFTRFWLEELFKDFEIISIKNDTWYFTTIALFFNLLFTKWKVMRFLFSPLFLVINSIAWILEFILLDIFYDYLQLKKISFLRGIIENTYKQFTANYILLIKNSKKQ